MALSAAATLIKGSQSDYGSDLDTDDENLLSELLSELEAAAPKPLLVESIEDEAITSPTRDLIVPKGRKQAPPQEYGEDVLEEDLRRRKLRSPSVEVEYAEHSRTSWSVAQKDSPGLDRSVPVEPEFDAGVEDTRSPLRRFRTKPMKPLSVTDLVSPAWCELQYWYNLSKFGRKRTTPAMKQGSAVHKILEEQVHEIVQVRPQTKEDAWGLRIWNVIQGLRTLRATGMTRELEIWGVIDGQVVNGIIDEVSYSCPDPGFEEKLEKSKTEAGNAANAALPPNQTSIADFLQQTNPSNQESGPWLGNPFPQRKVYITDVKTRGSNYIPKGVSLRPTVIQLMLYRMLLDALAANTVPADVIFSRYSVRPLQPFTPAFIEEIEELDFREETPSSANGAANVSREFFHELKTHNNLTALWSLMVSEFALAMSGAASISDVLHAEFRWSKTGEILGDEVFTYDADALQKYVGEEMQWWKGEREAKGVDIEEAFKCRICEFADECTWRKTKIEEAMEKHRLRIGARAKSAV